MAETFLEVLDTPAEFARLPDRDLSGTVCVVIDVLRATSSMVTALARGAAAILPVAEIPDALAARARDASLLLAGERDGLRIRAAQTGGTDFDLGNSPREFSEERVTGRRIAMTTTNGTRALHACRRAGNVFVGSLLNLQSTADAIRALHPPSLILVAAGTFEESALEDVLAAGALCDLLWDLYGHGHVADSATIARLLHQQLKSDLVGALGLARNGRRLLQRPELAEDVAFAAQLNAFPLVAALEPDGWVRRAPASR